MTTYRVEQVPWDGHDHGAEQLETTLNDLAADGWEIVTVVPVRAGASARSLLATSGMADTTDLAVVLRR